MQIIGRERQLSRRFTRASPAVPIAEVVAQPQDVHDLDGLRLIGESLTGKP
jgi:hypothetical protein